MEKMKEVPQDIITQQKALTMALGPRPTLTTIHHLERGLKPRHLTMIALCGALGIGLLVGMGLALAKPGLVGIFTPLSDALSSSSCQLWER